MKKTLTVLLVAATLATLLMSGPTGKNSIAFLPVVHAQDETSGCSLTSLKGPYALERQGTIIAQLPGFPAPPAPFGEVNIATFNGAGSFSGSAVVNIGGVALNPVTFTGTYTVNRDCTGTDTVFTSVGVALHNSIVVIAGGQRFISTQTDPWAVVQAKGQRLGD